MRLFVLGATGRTGAELVDQSLARGHAVTAFVRSPQKITRPHERLTVIEGDPRDAGQLRGCARGTGPHPHAGFEIVTFAVEGGSRR